MEGHGSPATPSTRVLVVTHYYPEHGGGVEIVAGQLAARVVRHGLVLEWAATGTPGELADPGVVPLPARAWNVTERRLGFPYPIWGPLGLLRLLAAVERCDVVHLHDTLYMGNVSAWLWARLRRKPVIVTQHIGLVPYSRRLLRWLHAAANRSLGRLILQRSRRAVFCSPRVRDYFASFCRFRTEPVVIPNGVATEYFSPVGAEERHLIRRRLDLAGRGPVMLFVGRYVQKKGLHLLREMAARFPDRLWVFAGRGPEAPSSWKLQNVLDLGALRHEETREVYRAADLLVLPSVGEGFPLVVQEAMSCGLPTLISRETAGGAPGVESVAWVSDLDSDSLVRTLELALEDPERLEGRRRACVEFARRHWAWPLCTSRYLDLYGEALESDGASPSGRPGRARPRSSPCSSR